MRITNHEAIKNAEQELIDTITGDLDWGIIEDIFRGEHHLEIDDNVEYKKGDIVVHDNQVVYRLEFDVKVALSVLVDREGNYISVSSSGLSEMIDDQNIEQGPDKSHGSTGVGYEAAMSDLKAEMPCQDNSRDADGSEPDAPEDALARIAEKAGEMAEI